MMGENTIIGQMARGEVPTKDVRNKAGVFTIKYPTGADFRLIAMKISDSLGGRPISSFLRTHLLIVERDCSLSVVIKKYPEDFPNCFQGDDIANYPDEEVKDSLYKEFGDFYQATQKELSGNAEGPAKGEKLGTDGQNVVS
jgi:hypothetical protein